MGILMLLFYIFKINMVYLEIKWIKIRIFFYEGVLIFDINVILFLWFVVVVYFFFVFDFFGSL